MLVSTICYSQPFERVTYVKQGQDSTSHTVDTILTTDFQWFKLLIEADSTIELSFTGFNNANDSLAILNTLAYSTPDWLDATIFSKILIRKQSEAEGATRYRYQLSGRGKY